MPELDTSHPFTTAQALAAGIPASRLRGRGFRRLSKGKYVAAARRPSPLLDAEAALLGHPPDAFASHTTAARVFGMPVPHDVESHVAVLSPGERRPRNGVRCHVAAADTRVVDVRGVRVTSPGHVFVQLADVLSLVDLVVVGDYLVAQGWCSPEQLVRVCADSSEAHAGKAHTAALFVRGGVDSPMETRLRLLLVLAGLPEPMVNHVVRDADGHVRRRFDLCYPNVRVIVEYDGRQHAGDSEQWLSDLRRREELDEGQWRIVVVTAEGIYQDPEETLRRVRRALVARGCSDVPRRFHPRWRTHFPARRAG